MARSAIGKSGYRGHGGGAPRQVDTKTAPPDKLPRQAGPIPCFSAPPTALKNPGTSLPPRGARTKSRSHNRPLPPPSGRGQVASGTGRSGSSPAAIPGAIRRTPRCARALKPARMAAATKRYKIRRPRQSPATTASYTVLISAPPTALAKKGIPPTMSFETPKSPPASPFSHGERPRADGFHAPASAKRATSRQFSADNFRQQRRAKACFGTPSELRFGAWGA